MICLHLEECYLLKDGSLPDDLLVFDPDPGTLQRITSHCYLKRCHCCGSGSKLYPYWRTLWIRIRIRNMDTDTEYYNGLRGTGWSTLRLQVFQLNVPSNWQDVEIRARIVNPDPIRSGPYLHNPVAPGTFFYQYTVPKAFCDLVFFLEIQSNYR